MANEGKVRQSNGNYRIIKAPQGISILPYPQIRFSPGKLEFLPVPLLGGARGGLAVH